MKINALKGFTILGCLLIGSSITIFAIKLFKAEDSNSFLSIFGVILGLSSLFLTFGIRWSDINNTFKSNESTSNLIEQIENIENKINSLDTSFKLNSDEIKTFIESQSKNNPFNNSLLSLNLITYNETKTTSQEN